MGCSTNENKRLRLARKNRENNIEQFFFEVAIENTVNVNNIDNNFELNGIDFDDIFENEDQDIRFKKNI